MKLLDTNVIIRFLTRDNPAQAEKARGLFEKVVAGKERLLVSDLAIAETVWVLEKVYKLKKPDIRAKIEAILNTANLFFQNRGLISESVVLYEIYNIDFIDAYHKVFMQKAKIKEIYSYDKDFDVFENIKRKEP
jgi:predicted nucleic acid-binding protein